MSLENNTMESEQVLFCTGGYDHHVKIWQCHTGQCLRTYQHADSQVNALDFTPDMQHIAAAGYQHVRMYDLASNNPNASTNYEGINKNVTSIGFHEEGHLMYTGGEDCCARIWDLRSRNLQCQRIFQVSAPVNGVSLHPNQTEMLVGDQSGIIHIWDLRTDANEQFFPEAEASILDVAINATGTLIASVNNKGNCYVWSAEGLPTKLTPKHKFEAHQLYALRCRFSPDGKWLVTTSADRTAKVWSTNDFSLHKTLATETQTWVWDAAFAANSPYLFTERPNCPKTLDMPPSVVADFFYFAVASSDGNARLWNVDTSNVEREFEGHQRPITALAFKEC